MNAARRFFFWNGEIHLQGKHMKITHTETLPVELTVNPMRAIQSSRGNHRVSPFVFVKIHTDEGIIGLGEISCTPVWSGEDHRTAVHFIADYLGPALVG